MFRELPKKSGSGLAARRQDSSCIRTLLVSNVGVEPDQNEKSVGYVYCKPAHVYAMHLAFREVIAEKTGATFDDREMTLAKMLIQLDTIARRLKEKGHIKEIPPKPDGWMHPPRRSDRLDIERAFGAQVTALAVRFQAFQPAVGPPITPSSSSTGYFRSTATTSRWL